VRTLRSYWPIAVFIISSVLHTDLAILTRPIIQRVLGIDLTTFLVALLVVSSLQVWFEYWFYGWCRQLAITDIWAWLTDGFWDRCVALGFDQQLRQIGSALKTLRDGWNSMTSGWRQHRHPVVKGTSYTALFALSIAPVPGIRGPAIAVCGMMKLRWGLVLMVVGNAVRGLYLVLGIRWLWMLTH